MEQHTQNGAYVEKLSQMLRCKTVWTREGTYEAEFQRFYALLEALFPHLHARAERLNFGGGCFVYVIRGKNARRNIMLMSHHDVVDGGEGWLTDPFQPVEKDGYLYGRGTLDTKTSLFGLLQAAEELLAEGYDFEGIDLYLGSSNNEEVGGDGMVLATEYFREQGIRFWAVYDEGGAITQGQIPGVTGKSAMIAVHEKSMHIYRCTAQTEKKQSAIQGLSRFITQVRKKKDQIFRGRFYPEVVDTFRLHVPHMAFPMNVLFGARWLFAPLIKRIMMGIPAASAMLSTGLTFTTVTAGDPREPRRQAKTAEATLYLRCIREEELYAGLEKLRKLGKKCGVTLEEVDRQYCPPADPEGPAYKTLEAVIREVFPEVKVVAPYLLTAATDGRRFAQVADQVLRFAPIDMDRQQYASVHFANECIAPSCVGESVVFYRTLIRRL